MALNEQLSAQITLTGMTMDLIGGLYLAYDLLGGDKGPLSTLTRCVTYTLILVLSISTTMGLKFGLLAGAGLGIALGLHLERIGRGQNETKRFLFSLALIRSIGLFLAAWYEKLAFVAFGLVPVVFAAAFLLPRLKLTPAFFYEVGKKPSFSYRKLCLSLVLGGLAASVGFIAAFLQHDLGHMGERVLRLSLTIAMATGLTSSLIPLIEWYADNLPGRTMGYIGATLFVLGFMMQSVPSLAVLVK